MIIDFLQAATGKHAGHASQLSHLGASGLFFLAILDGTPLPTFGGPDIVMAILAGSHRSPWYQCAAIATLGSVIGAYLTFRMARHAGSAYLQSHFRSSQVHALLKIFERWGTGALAASTAIPFPFPTSLFFAAAGASRYRTRTYLTVVTLCRAARYSLIALLADRYGRHFVRIVRHPARYWGWLLILAGVVGGISTAAIFIGKRLEAAPAADLVSA